jgi:beta-lactamase class A
MKRGSYTFLRWISIFLLFSAVLLVVFALVGYSRMRSTFPAGTTIGGIPVGGLDQQQSADRLIQAYSLPIEVHYSDAIMQLKPSNVGFELRLEAMIADADIKRVAKSFWGEFWDYLWNRVPSPIEIPLSSSVSEQQLRGYLQNEISSRYDEPAEPARPVPGSIVFQTGKPGKVLDIDKAIVQIEDALKSPTERVINLSYVSSQPARPSFQNLEVLLKQIVTLSSFDGLIELNVIDLQDGQEINFAIDNGEEVEPDIAFTAASTIKIPVLVAVYRATKEPTLGTIQELIKKMIAASSNESTDALVESVLDTFNGPLKVTADMQELGLKNTFFAGYFYSGAPLLQRVSTPANQRTDINLEPDPYNQTTPSDMAMILEDIYQCAQDGGGAFTVVFPGEITQTECQAMLNVLQEDRIAVLLEAGLPDGSHIAHKHGWVTDPAAGIIFFMSDAGIVFSSGGDYVITVNLYHPTQLIFDPANQLVAQLSRAVFNYYNLGSQ